MYVNLYVTFPTSGPADAWAYAWHKWPVGAHIILGTLILLGGISLLVRAIRRKNRHWITYSAIAVFGLLLSYLGGERFITTLNDIASYLMSVGFLIAFLAFNWGLYTQSSCLPSNEVEINLDLVFISLRLFPKISSK